MIKVNNKKAIDNISKKSFKANRLRNIVAICAIALTAILFTGLFTISGSILKTSEQSACRQVGTSAHAGYKYLTQEEYDAVKTHPSIKDISYNIILAMSTNPELSKVHTEIRYSEDKSAKWGFSYPETGSMPKEYKDLATSTIVLDALGIPHEIGQKVTLDFSVRGKDYHETFNLCGFWEGDTVATAQQVWLSKDFVLDAAPLYTVPYYERDDYDFYGTIDCSLWFNSAFNIEGKITKVSVDSGYDPNLIRQAVNWAYGGAEIDLTTIVLIIMLLMLVMVSGYLIIFNVFYISVAKDARYYGLLKTIGATGKQLRKIVRKQALYLSLIGIPIGLILGYIIGIILLPVVIDTTYYAGQSVASANALIFIGSAAFSLITVFMSCRKPAKLASQVSPMEALRYYEAFQPKSKKRKTKKVSPFSMAVQNVFRSRKKVFSVVLSLSLSIILLNSVYTVVTGFDMDKFLQDKTVSDLSVCNAKLLTQYELTYIDEKALSDIAGISGVSETGAVYMAENYHKFSDAAFPNVQKIIDECLSDKSGNKDTVDRIMQDKTYIAHIYGIEKIVYDKLNFLDSEVNYEKFLSGDYVYVSPYLTKGNSYEYPYYKAGDKVLLDFGEGDTKEYTVLGLAKLPYPASCMHSHIIDPQFILPADEYLEHYTENSPLHILINAENGSEAEVERAVSSYCDGTEMSYVSKNTLSEEFYGLQRMFVMVGGILSAVLGLIGLLNFMNTTITSIISRRRELAMLQSVGMTVKQLRQMLVSEGFIYAGITVLAAISIGNLFVYLIVKLIAGQIWFFTYHLTLLPTLICIPLLILIAYLIPLLSYKSIQKQSIVERLREAE